MKWLGSRTAVVVLVAVAAVLTIGLGTWQGWLAQAAPDTVYVNDNLLPDVDGCNAPDANTIADGILAADPADTVVVCEGTYAGATVNKSVIIEGRADANRAAIVVEGGAGSDGFVVTADDVTIRHISLDGVDGTGAGIVVEGDDATIQDVEAVQWNAGLVLDASDGSVIEDSEVDDNTDIGIGAFAGRNNVIRQNLVGADNDAGLVIQDEDLTLVDNNDLSGTDVAVYLDSFLSVLNVRLVRNTIHGGAGSDGIFIDVLEGAESLVVIGGRPENANQFMGTPDGVTEFFVELSCGSEATVAAIWNYWAGLTDRADIADVIYDDEDQDDCGDPHGAVVFHPWATSPAPTPTPSPTPEPSPSPSPSPTPGTRTFDLQTGWNNFVWTGATGTDPATVLSCIDGNYAIAYRFLAIGQSFERYIPGDAALSNMTNLNQYDSLLVLVTGTGVQCQDMPVASAP
jgi:hypothetical protein